MASEDQERKGRKRRRETHESPTQSTKRRQTRKRDRTSSQASSEFYGVKSIIDENGDKYLIDWEDDPKTGKSYSPTWEPKENANDAAITAWEEIKSTQGSEGQLRSEAEKTTIEETSQESVPVRIAKRKRAPEVRNSTQESNSLSEPESKHPKFDAGGFHGITTISPWSQGRRLARDEIPDSLEEDEETNSSIRAADIQVAISIHSSLDTSAYVNATAESSQQPFSAGGSQIHIRTPVDIRKRYSQNSTEIPDSQEVSRPAGKNLRDNFPRNSSAGQPDSSTQTTESSLRGEVYQDNLPVVRTSSGSDNSPASQNLNENRAISQSQLDEPTESNGPSSRINISPFQDPIESQQHSRIEVPTQSDESSRFRFSPEQLSFRNQVPSTDQNNHTSGIVLDQPTSAGRSGENWQTAQVVSPIDPPSSFHTNSDDIFNFIIFPDNAESPAPEEHSQNRIDQSILSQQNGNSAGNFSPSRQQSKDKSQEFIANSINSPSVTSSIDAQGYRRIIAENLSSTESTNLDSFRPGLFTQLSGVPELPESYGSTSLQRPEPLSSSNMSNGQDVVDLTSNASSDVKTPLSVREMIRLRRAQSAATGPVTIGTIGRASSGTPTASTPSSLLPAAPVPALPVTGSMSTVSSTPAAPVPALPVTGSMSTVSSTPAAPVPALPVTGSMSTVSSTPAAPVPALPVTGSMSTVSSTRSPSLTPARVSSPQLPAPPSSQAAASSNQMLPNRSASISTPSVPSNPPRAAPSIAAKEEEDSDTEDDNTELPYLGDKEYIVPLPMMSNVRKIYETVLRNSKREIHDFNATGNVHLVMKMEKMIDALKKLGDHQDIDTEVSPSQASMTDEIVRKWAETCSTKCAFIRELLDALRSVQIHVAILARPGRMLDILEAMFRSQKYTYSRRNGQKTTGQNGTGSLVITLLPTGIDCDKLGPIRADVVIAYDETSRLGDMHSRIRNGPANKTSPVIFLVVTNSAEHLELCIPSSAAKSLARTQALVNAIVKTQHDVGKLGDEEYQPDQAAIQVARYLTSVASGVGVTKIRWPLAPISEIPGVDYANAYFTPDYLLTSSTPTIPASDNLRRAVHNSAKKRTIDAADSPVEDSNAKRARSTPARDLPSSSMAIPSRQTRATAKSKQLAPEYIQLEHTNNALSEECANLRAQLDAKSKKVTEVETEREKERRAQREETRFLYEQINSHQKSIHDNIVPKYQETIKEAADAKRSEKQLSERNQALVKQTEHRDADIQKLKKEQSSLTEELKTLREALSTSKVPDLQSLASKDEEIRALKASLDSTQKKLAAAEKMEGFLKHQYSEASTAAAKLRTELSTKDEEIVQLSRKASENVAICAQMQAQSEKADSDRRISELEALLQDREEELIRKNKEITNSGRSTRRRSPMMQADRGERGPRTVSSIGLSRSRGASPTVGELRGDAESMGGVPGLSNKRVRQLLSTD